MVANVGEILDPEEEEGGEHDGSGFNVQRSGNDKKEVK
mgnify:CR=1 FL=1